MRACYCSDGGVSRQIVRLHGIALGNARAAMQMPAVTLTSTMDWPTVNMHHESITINDVFDDFFSSSLRRVQLEMMIITCARSRSCFSLSKTLPR